MKLPFGKDSEVIGPFSSEDKIADYLFPEKDLETQGKKLMFFSYKCFLEKLKNGVQGVFLEKAEKPQVQDEKKEKVESGEFYLVKVSPPTFKPKLTGLFSTKNDAVNYLFGNLADDQTKKRFLEGPYPVMIGGLGFFLVRLTFVLN